MVSISNIAHNTTLPGEVAHTRSELHHDLCLAGSSTGNYTVFPSCIAWEQRTLISLDRPLHSSAFLIWKCFQPDVRAWRSFEYQRSCRTSSVTRIPLSLLQEPRSDQIKLVAALRWPTKYCSPAKNGPGPKFTINQIQNYQIHWASFPPCLNMHVPCSTVWEFSPRDPGREIVRR